MDQPPYLANLKTLLLLDQTVVFVLQHSSLFVYFQSSFMSTSLSEDCAVCGKTFKRLGAHLVRSLACGSYYMPRRADTDERHENAGITLSESASHSTRPNLRSPSYSTLFRGDRATVREEAEDNPVITNVNGVDDEDFVVINEDDAFPNGNVDEEDVPTDASEGEEGPDGDVLDLYLKLFQLRDNPLGLARFSREEEVLIELLQLLKDLHCPLKAFEIILKWAAKSNSNGHTFHKGCQPTRKKVIANLYERYNMNGLIPMEKKLYLPFTQRTVSIVYFKASELFASLLSCPTLNQDKHYHFDKAKDPFVAPQKSADVGDIHTGRGYRKTYEALIKNPGVDLLLPCVIAMDKTTIDMAGRINMEPITVSHGLLNHDICRLPIAMRILGYIHHSTPPHLPSGANVDSAFISPIELPDDVVRVKNPIRRPANGNVSWATLLLNETHMQIQFILKESGFLRLQNRGFKWNLEYNNTIHKVVFHPYVPFIVGDTEGHDRLCGHYTARFMEVKQLCRICECPSYLTGYSKSKFPHRLPRKVDSLVQRGLTGELQSISQHYLKNGFEGVRFGMHNKRGIFGACPGEMLHLISLGWFKYCLQAFSAQAGPKSQALKDYDALCAKLGYTLSRQSDRDVPRTNFSRGFSSGSNLMGHEMTGCLLVKLFALHTTCFRSIFNVGKKVPRKGVDDQRLCYSNHIQDWIVVVSSLLVWHQWMKQPTIPKKMVRRSHAAAQWLMRFVAEVAPRASGMGNNTIKTHLVLHLCEDILDHGVPENVNSSYAESAHIPLAKVTTRNTQKRAFSFTIQAAYRYIENLVISLAWADIESDTRQHNTNSREDGPETEEAVNANISNHVNLGREFHLVWNTGDEVPTCRWTHVRNGQKLEPTVKLSPLVSKFLGHYCLPQMPHQSLSCFTSYTDASGNTYRAHPCYDGKPWNDCAMIHWKGEVHDLPAFIHTFVDLRQLPTAIKKIEANGQMSVQPGLYAVAHTFDPVNPTDFNTPNVLIGRYKPHFYSPNHRRPTLFLVDVNAISSPLFGTEDIPPFGEKKSSRWDRQYLFLVRRKVEWHLAWDAIIEREHSDLENNVEDDTWFEKEYEQGTVDHVMPGGRAVFSVKTPEDNAKEVAATKAQKLAAKKKKEGEAATKKRKRAVRKETVLR